MFNLYLRLIYRVLLFCHSLKCLIRFSHLIWYIFLLFILLICLNCRFLHVLINSCNTLIEYPRHFIIQYTAFIHLLLKLRQFLHQDRNIPINNLLYATNPSFQHPTLANLSYNCRIFLIFLTFLHVLKFLHATLSHHSSPHFTDTTHIAHITHVAHNVVYIAFFQLIANLLIHTRQLVLRLLISHLLVLFLDHCKFISKMVHTLFTCPCSYLFRYKTEITGLVLQHGLAEKLFFAFLPPILFHLNGQFLLYFFGERVGFFSKESAKIVYFCHDGTRRFGGDGGFELIEISAVDTDCF